MLWGKQGKIKRRAGGIQREIKKDMNKEKARRIRDGENEPLLETRSKETLSTARSRLTAKPNPGLKGKKKTDNSKKGKPTRENGGDQTVKAATRKVQTLTNETKGKGNRQKTNQEKRKKSHGRAREGKIEKPAKQNHKRIVQEKRENEGRKTTCL